MDRDNRAAQARIDSLPEPRRSQMQHLHDVITAAIPDADVTMFDYSGPLIGYGTYDYSNSKGDRTGRWFSSGSPTGRATSRCTPWASATATTWSRR